MSRRCHTDETPTAYGYSTSAQLAKKLGAKQLSRSTNEFELNGEHVVIQPARKKDRRVAVFSEVLDHIQAVLAAYKIGPNEYGLVSLSADLYRKFMRTPHGNVGLVTKCMFLRRGSAVATVNLDR